MTAPSKLAKWREGARLSPRAAARYLRISPETYRALEAGKGECPPSLALDIAARTHMTVMPGDLPGCEIPAGIDPSGCNARAVPVTLDAAAVAGERHAPATVNADRDAGARDVGLSAPAVGAAGDDAAPATLLPCAWSVPNRVLVSMTGGDRDIFTLDPQAAGDLGMQLVRAAIAAVRP